MNIYVAKNQQKHGPYTPAEVSARMASGQFAETDLAWHEGMADWLPLARLVAELPSGPGGAPLLPPPRSGLAKASFIISMVGLGAWFVLILVAAVAVSSGARETGPLMIVVGLAMFAGMAANLAGILFGAVVLTKPIANKWMAVTGVIANSVELCGVLFLMILGWSQK